MTLKNKLLSFFLLVAFLAGSGVSTAWAVEVNLIGDTKQAVATDPNGKYTFTNIPLRRNSVNRFTVSTGEGSQKQSREVKITQISLNSVVVSKIKSEPLSVQEIEKLVNDGVIQLDDPANFNVSKFEIVLTIGHEEIPISIPVVTGLQEETGSEEVPPQSDPGNGGSSSKIPDTEIIVFETFPPGPPGEPPPPPIPGVLIIEGRIKSLKEFYSVRLLLMNTSGIFTLHDVSSNIEFPDGGLSKTLPQDGIVQYGDILPGDGEVPGQKEREFIIRGDEIGVRGVKVNFGGTLIGPGIPEDEPIPFNGSAETTVEVKGPPEFRVQVIHPPAVVKDVPYELVVDITNIGETPALYTSFELDVGGGGELVDCSIDSGGNPVCSPIKGSAVRNIGHLLPGQNTRQTFNINPFESGPITSCMSIADQNIDLQVLVGALGCINGKRPPKVAVPDGVPTVSVLPTANAFGVSIDSPVTLFFSEKMNISTITTGADGTFNVFDDAGDIVPGKLTFLVINDATVAIWQVNDGITNRLKGNTTFRIVVSQNIADLQGVALPGEWESDFTTTDPTNDTTPPALTLSVEPPVNLNYVIPGQLIRFNAYPSDQGTGVARVELRMKDTDVPNSLFALIDQKVIFPTTSGPTLFSVDSSQLVPGHTYQFKATAFDNAGNSQDATLPIIVAPSAAPPSIVLPSDPANPVLQGISVTLMPDTLSQGVKQVDYFLDSEAKSFKTVTLSPFSATLPTLELPLGAHTIRAVATDGLGQTGQDTFGFILANNPSEPVTGFGNAVSGAQFIKGAVFSVQGSATDPLGIASVEFFLDSPAGTPIAKNAVPFNLDTKDLALGAHRIYIKATNKVGVSNDLNKSTSYLDFEVLPIPGAGPPPAAPSVTSISFPENGLVTVVGTSVSAARVDIYNQERLFTQSVFADAGGAFTAVVDAAAGEHLRLTALKLSLSQQSSAPTDVVVPPPPVLDHITASPGSRTFTAVNQIQDILVTAFYEGGTSKDVTSQAVFSSNNTSVATVNADGRVVNIGNGTAVITVSFGGKTTQVNITVNIVTLTGISITPDSFKLIGLAKTRTLVVNGSYSNGTTAPLDLSNVVLSSTNPSVAFVSPSGVVTSAAYGNAVISATISGFAPAQSSVTVEPIAPTGISLAPNVILFTEEDETRQLVVTVHLNDGNSEAPSGTVLYSSGDTGIATVSASGLVTAVANGDVTIQVTYAGFTENVTVTVDIPPPGNPPPVITALDRLRAGEGDIFVIRGTYFAAIPGENLVKVNGLQAEVQSARTDELTVVVPNGATTGLVTVEVSGKESNGVTLGIYGRRAVASLITLALDMAASPGQKLNLPGPVIDFRAGDKVYLSSAPDLLAPLSFEGVLRAKIDGGSFFTVSPSANAVDLSAQFTPGNHTVTLELGESAGKFVTSAIYVSYGPSGTGSLAGQRSVLANGQSRPVAVTFLNLKDASNNPLPDGTHVLVSASSACFRDPVTNGCIPSHGGSISNGTPSPDGYGLMAFTVKGGRIDVLYEPSSAPPLRSRELKTASVFVLPSNTNDNRTSDRAIALTTVTLTAMDTVGTTRSQSSTVADGLEKVLNITFSNARDTDGQLVPDGAPFLVTVEAPCFRDPDTNNCVPSAGGSILSGDASPDGYGLRRHFISGGQATVQYSPGGVLLAYPDSAIANIQFLPSLAGGQRIGDQAFQLTPITLSSARSPTVSAPSSVFADTGDNRVVVTFSNFSDSLGNPIPDGTKLVVTAQSPCFRDPDDNTCVPSVGGQIISGDDSPDGFGLKTHTVQNRQIEVTYSAIGVGMQSFQAALVSVQVLPAKPNGQRIGDRAIALAKFTATGYHNAAASANPAAVVADGLSKSVTVTISNIRDTQGNVVPDGAIVLLTASEVCFRHPDDNTCVGSRGGDIVSGTASPDGYGLRAHVVNGGQVTATYDPASVALAFPDVKVANIQVLPGKPNFSRLGDRAFVLVPVTLSSLQQASVNVVPPSVLGNNAPNLSQITLSSIKDALGNSVPNGTKIVVTALANCLRDPVTNNCVGSAGGTITSGTPSPDGLGLQVHTITGGSSSITYSSEPIALEARQATVANVQVLPAQPNGSRVGNRAFTVIPVTIAGYQSVDVSGPGQIAPNATASYVLSNFRDTSGNPIADGNKIVVTPLANCLRDPDTGNCVGSSGGTIINGTASPDGLGLKSFTITGGQVTVQFQAPASPGTSVLQILPARPNDSRIGNYSFTLKSVSIQPAGG